MRCRLLGARWRALRHHSFGISSPSPPPWQIFQGKAERARRRVLPPCGALAKWAVSFLIVLYIFFLSYCPSVCCFLIVLLFLPSPSRFKYTFFIALLSLKRKRKLEEGALIITLSSAITRVSFVCCSGAAFFYFCDSSLARSY